MNETRSSTNKGIVTNILKYSVALLIAAFLLWFVYRDFDFSDLRSKIHEVNFTWIYISIILSLISHVLRAYRWNLLLNPLGYKHLKVWRTFLAVMSGYFVNLLLPRAGEITRCGILRKNEGVPMSSSIGSVIAERVFDFIVLISLIVITFFLQIDILGNFLSKFFGEKYASIASNAPILIMAGAVALFLLILVIYLVKKYKSYLSRMPLFNKIVNFIKELMAGAMSIRKLENQLGFWGSTVFIWLLYFLMAYVVFFSIPSTSHLGILAGLSVLIMGGLGMSAPVQGGIGAYHLLVGGVLVLYGIEKEEGVFFALVLHTSQFLSVLFFGGISLMITIFQKKAPLQQA